MRNDDGVAEGCQIVCNGIVLIVSSFLPGGHGGCESLDKVGLLERSSLSLRERASSSLVYGIVALSWSATAAHLDYILLLVD